jgi:Holliday junction resolvase RusA-like endonuclease
MAPELDRLAVVLADTAWVTRTVRSNTDQAVMDLFDAARAAVESGEQGRTPDPPPASLTPIARIRVMGHPAPQGSKTYMPKTRVMVEGSSKTGRARLHTWRDSVTAECHKVAATLDGPIDVPVQVTAVFRLPMPRSRPKWIQSLGEWPSSTKPDLDKLVRALLDSMKMGGLLRDDSIVADLGGTRKVEVVGWTGVDITLSAVSIPARGT